MIEEEKIGNLEDNISYDSKYDILKIKYGNCEYSKSLETNGGNIVLHLDKKGRLFGFEIFDASEVLGITKERIVSMTR